jgi:hypothetical protein
MLCTAKHHTWRAATAAAAGPAADTGSASILFAPNTTEVQGLMLLLAKAAACPPDAVQPRRNSRASFYQYWAASAGAAAAAGHPECLSGGTEACRAQPACYLPLYRRQLVGHASAELAVAAAAAEPGSVDAVLDFTAWQQQASQHRQQGQQAAQQTWQQAQQGEQALQQGEQTQQQGEQQQRFLYPYTIRMNHSEVPPTRMRLNQVGHLPPAAATAVHAAHRPALPCAARTICAPSAGHPSSSHNASARPPTHPPIHPPTHAV